MARRLSKSVFVPFSLDSWADSGGGKHMRAVRSRPTEIGRTDSVEAVGVGNVDQYTFAS
jgi:hypothetical protein